MKKLLLLILLTFSSITYAQWIVIAYVPEQLGMLFIDKSTIQQVNQYTRVWTKVEYHPTSEMSVKQNVLSVRALYDFDCREKKYRNLSFQTFKQPNLIDSDLTNNKQDEWKFIAPGTIADSELIIICKK